jgi:hypothetical protein
MYLGNIYPMWWRTIPLEKCQSLSRSLQEGRHLYPGHGEDSVTWFE